YVTTPDVTRATARVTIRTTVRNAPQADQPITLRTVLYDAAGREVAAGSTEARVARDSASEVAQDLVIRNPTPWSLERPYLDSAACSVRELSDMVRRDRNHPSVFMWSIGNEVMEQWTNGDSTAAPIARELAGIVRGLDPTRPITSANNNGSPGNPVLQSRALD